jgi:putative phosphoesterase
MLIGILGDTHDHLENIRRAVDLFNARGCGQVLHAGDIVSPIALPPFRKLACRMRAVFGDNDGNRSGLLAGFGVLGELSEPPVEIRTEDGRRIVLTHRREDLGTLAEAEPPDLVVFSHTHRTYSQRRGETLWLNPGEACGWVFGEATVAVYDTQTGEAEITALGND